jgi:hypothetical protein
LKKKEESYEITFKGLLTGSIKDPVLLQAVLDDLELYFRRHLMTDKTFGAVIFDGKRWIMTTVEKG